MYENPSQDLNSIRVEDHAPLVKRIASHMMMRMPASVQIEDLIQAGMIGLLEAAQKYDPSQGASFETYAGIRIRGAIVDEMRRGDWVPRSVHRNARRVAEAIATVEARVGRTAADQEVAEEMDVSLDEYHSILNDTTSCRLFSFEEEVGGEESVVEPLEESGAFATPQEDYQRESLRKSLAESIATLPEREQLVLSLYYNEEMNLKEIGQVLGVSESRVSQIHSQAAMRLRARMTGWTK